MSKLLFWIERKLAALVMRLLRSTIKFEIENRNPDSQRCIYIFWHRNLLLLMLHRMGDPIAVLVSASKDGELIAGPAEELGYITVRGSSSRNGYRALKEMVSLCRERQLAITPDGPKGPPKVIKQGVFEIALLGQIPIIPAVAEADREWSFNSWDRFRFPKPFARIKVLYGKPFYVKSKDDISRLEAEISAYITELEMQLSR